jgi:hypothetical protein
MQKLKSAGTGSTSAICLDADPSAASTNVLDLEQAIRARAEPQRTADRADAG